MIRGIIEALHSSELSCEIAVPADVAQKTTNSTNTIKVPKRVIVHRR